MNYYKFAQDKGIKTTYDDFLFEQQAIRDSFKAIVSAFGNSNATFVLWGCEDTGNIQVADGWVCIEGEIYKHDLTVYPDLDTGIDGYYWDIEETFDPAGKKTTDLTTAIVQQRIIRKAILKPFIAGDPTIPLPVNRVDMVLTKRLNLNFNLNWITPDPIHFTSDFISDSAYPFQYTKDNNGFVHMRGNIKNIGGVNGYMCGSGMFTLPYQTPKNIYHTQVAIIPSANPQTRIIRKTTDSKLFLYDAPNVAVVNEIICMDGFSYFVGI